VWVNFYGLESYIDGEPLHLGDIVRAYDPDDVNCGCWVVTYVGQYGLMAVYGDVPGAEPDEGAEPGESIHFTVNDQPAIPQGPDAPSGTGNGDLQHVELNRGNATATPTETQTPTATPTDTSTATATPTPTATMTATATPTATPMEAPTTTHTPTASVTATATPTATATEAPTGTHTPTATETATATPTATVTPTPTATLMQALTGTVTPTTTETATATHTATATQTPTPTETGTATATPTATAGLNRIGANLDQAGRANVGLEEPLVVRFSDLVQPNTARFSMQPWMALTVTWQLSEGFFGDPAVEADVATIWHPQPFQPATQYALRLWGGSAIDGRVVEPALWRFTTLRSRANLPLVVRAAP